MASTRADGRVPMRMRVVVFKRWREQLGPGLGTPEEGVRAVQDGRCKLTGSACAYINTGSTTTHP
jgi:hypothetical protein